MSDFTIGAGPVRAPAPWPRAPRPEPPWAADVPLPESIHAPAALPIARIAHVSLWRRFVAWWHWRSKAELLALVERQRGLLEAKEREVAQLREWHKRVAAENRRLTEAAGKPYIPILPMPGAGVSSPR